MKIDILVDFDAFWDRLAQDIATANRRVLVQTFSFEADRVGTLLATTLDHSAVADKRILVDSFSRIVLSDKFRFAPAHWSNTELRTEAKLTKQLHERLPAQGIEIKYGNPLGPTPRRLVTRNHKKLIVVDEHISYIGGVNFSEHNAAWHDMMLRIESAEVGDFFRADFEAAWRGESFQSSGSFAGIELSTLNGRSNRDAFTRVLDLIDQTNSSIFVESPYITFPFYDRLRAARRRGVQVTIVTPEENNWNHFADYARWEATRGGLDLRLLGGMSHLKAMLLDDRHLIAGSSNFDFLSYRVYQEILAVITRPEVIASFRAKVQEVDLLRSHQAQESETRASAWSRLRVRLLNMGLTLLLE